MQQNIEIFVGKSGPGDASYLITPMKPTINSWVDKFLVIKLIQRQFREPHGNPVWSGSPGRAERLPVRLLFP